MSTTKKQQAQNPATKKKKVAPKSTKRTTVAKVLSNDEKIARMEVWATKLGLDKDVVTQMTEKYGPYAYKIMTEAMQAPTDLMKKAGQKPRSSKGTVKYFADAELSTAQLSKIVGENELKVQSKLANYQIASTPNPTPVVQKEQDNAKKSAQRLDERVDEQSATAPAEQRSEPTAEQKKQMQSWARQVGLSTADMNNLITKYGSVAYDIVHDSMYKPSVVMKNMDEKPLGSSKKTIQYFLNNDVPTEKLVKAFGKSEEEIENARTNSPQIEDNIQPTAYNEKSTQQSGNLSEYSIKNMSTKPAKNKTDLQNQAYDNFAESEGKRSDIYLDCNGHPTTGVGHLIFNVNDVNNPDQMKKWKERFLSTCDYPNMNKAQQGALFETLASQMRIAMNYKNKHKCDLNQALRQTSLGAKDVKGAGWDLTASYIQKAKLTDSGIRKAFNSDFDYWYKKTKGNLPQFDTYPLPVQLSVLHTAFAGQLAKISSKDCQRDVCKLMDKVSKVRNPRYVPAAEGDTTNIARRSVGLPPVPSRSSTTRVASKGKKSRTGHG